MLKICMSVCVLVVSVDSVLYMFFVFDIDNYQIKSLFIIAWTLCKVCVVRVITT